MCCEEEAITGLRRAEKFLNRNLGGISSQTWLCMSVFPSFPHEII